MTATDRLQDASSPAGVSASGANYIKLGHGGAHAQSCLEGGYIGLGFDRIPHALCLAGDWDAVRQRFLHDGKSPSKASDHTREVRTFYEAGADVLWITFAQGKLWWTFAEDGVSWEPTQSGRLPRRRKTIGSWRCSDIHGGVLLTRNLSARLSSVAYYRSTLCEVREKDYLISRLNGQKQPLVADADRLRDELHKVAQQLIATLHPRDFEIMVDLIFNASGWRRVSVLGETEADSDLLLEQIATGERAFVQVKSRATPATLIDYMERFRSRGDCGRMFFVCHTPSRALAARANVEADVDVWLGETLADKALRAGLFDWLVERVR